jgi:beta-lactamase regulating signal transducer with metallopeptidase domain
MIRALGWSLLHFVWQGAAVAAVLASLNLLMRRAAPQVRYLLASSTLLLMLLLPAATFQVMRGLEEPAGRAAPAAGPVGEWATPVTAASGSLVGSTDGSATRELRSRVERLLPGLVGLWGAGVLVLSLRALGGWALVQRLRRSGLTAVPAAIESTVARLVGALRVSAPVRLYESALVQVPTVIGWLRPVILLPASALTGLSAGQLELILAHELAHIRRCDYLMNLLQTTVETLLFYHPAVWWVSHRLRVEREHCCDDLAVAAGGNATRYARALADLEGLCSDAPALAMAATGGSLFERIARLVGPPQHPSRTSRGLATLLALASMGLAVGAGTSLVGGPAAPMATASAFVLPESGSESPAPQADPKAKPKPAPQAKPEPRAFPLERVLEMAQAGVTPEYIDEMDALGYPALTAEQLVALRSQGVGPEYVRALAGEGYKGLTTDQLMSLRSQGVSAHFASGLKEQGLANLSISDLIELRSQGVSPEYVAELKKAGYDDLSVSKLMALRSQGVSGHFATELKALGYDKLPISKLLALRSQGVGPEYVRELADLGYRGLEVPMLLGLRNQGVTPEYVRALKEVGYADLPVGMLIELRSHGVSPDFVRELKEAGLTNLKPEELIELRNHGVRGEWLKRLKGK